MPIRLTAVVPGPSARLASGIGVLLVSLVPVLRGATIWTGPPIVYTQPGTDPTQPANQDRITPNVWLTRAAIQGLFNARTEASFTHFFSPEDTRWANGTTANYA